MCDMNLNRTTTIAIIYYHHWCSGLDIELVPVGLGFESCRASINFMPLTQLANQIVPHGALRLVHIIMTIHLSTNPKQPYVPCHLPHVPHICHVSFTYMSCVNHTWFHVSAIPCQCLLYSLYNDATSFHFMISHQHSLFPFFFLLEKNFKSSYLPHTMYVWDHSSYVGKISSSSMQCNHCFLSTFEIVKFWAFLYLPRSLRCLHIR